jgi:hypothetical protein
MPVTTPELLMVATKVFPLLHVYVPLLVASESVTGVPVHNVEGVPDILETDGSAFTVTV